MEKPYKEPLLADKQGLMLGPVVEDYTAAQINHNRLTQEHRRQQALQHGYFSTLPDELLTEIIKLSTAAERYEVDGTTCFPYGYRPALLQVSKQLYNLTRPISFTQKIIYHLEHDLNKRVDPVDNLTLPATEHGLEFLWSSWEQDCVSGFVITMLNTNKPRIRALAALPLSFSQHDCLDGLTAESPYDVLYRARQESWVAQHGTLAGCRCRFVKLHIDLREGHTTVSSSLQRLTVERTLAEIFNEIVKISGRATFRDGRLRVLNRANLAIDQDDVELHIIKGVLLGRWGSYSDHLRSLWTHRQSSFRPAEVLDLLSTVHGEAIAEQDAFDWPASE